LGVQKRGPRDRFASIKKLPIPVGEKREMKGKLTSNKRGNLKLLNLLNHPTPIGPLPLKRIGLKRGFLIFQMDNW
jgi:hypothetical protein